MLPQRLQVAEKRRPPRGIVMGREENHPFPKLKKTISVDYLVIVVKSKEWVSMPPAGEAKERLTMMTNPNPANPLWLWSCIAETEAPVSKCSRKIPC